MNREDIIRMADEACIYMDADTDHWYYELERFAALAFAAGAAAEREACAKVCDVVIPGDEYSTALINSYADDIRARGNT